MRFYGTSAAEGIPSSFCSCRVCMNARKVGGKEIRRRSMLRLSETACIDLGADAFQQAIEYGDFVNLKHVLITHTHEDHFAFMMMNVRNMSKERIEEPLHLYLTDKAYEIIEFFRRSSPIIKGMTEDLEKRGVIVFHPLSFHETYSIDSMTVTPYRGNHYGNMGENSANYLIRLPDGRTLYYGLDTGWYLEETFEALSGKNIDILISECTFALRQGRDLHPKGHLDAYSCIALFDELLSRSAITPETDIYLTHIGQSSTHEELMGYFASECKQIPNKITVAFDGMVIE
jgi:phosphoribosyl 1,2-cyclic phosphate phosphodiesterase